MIALSKRLEAIAALITPGGTVADVGTDHGYLPIYQLQHNRSPRAIAMDLRKGPLERAAEHIGQCGLADRIETRLSDGVAALGTGEADTIVVAGMGGELILHILDDGEEVCRSAKELILQPQSEVAKVRRYLRGHAYRIAAEDMIYEDGKYYPLMRVVPQEDGAAQAYIEPEVLYDLYGEFLLRGKHPVLRQYLVQQGAQLADILASLERQPQSGRICARVTEIRQKLEYNKAAQMYYKNVTIQSP
jgi:tRNA (adenine22-N1)-methyltransferase